MREINGLSPRTPHQHVRVLELDSEFQSSWESCEGQNRLFRWKWRAYVYPRSKSTSPPRSWSRSMHQRPAHTHMRT